MNVHIVAPIEVPYSFKLSEPDCVAAARRRRRNLLIILGLSGLSWLLIGALIVALS